MNNFISIVVLNYSPIQNHKGKEAVPYFCRWESKNKALSESIPVTLLRCLVVNKYDCNMS